MAGSSRPNANNLEALGAAKLAELLITLSEGDAGAKRLLRLAWAEQKGPAERVDHSAPPMMLSAFSPSPLSSMSALQIA